MAGASSPGVAVLCAALPACAAVRACGADVNVSCPPAERCWAPSCAVRAWLSQAVLKIIKHCRESLPTFVAGSMVGLAMDSTLEVTNCFPFPPDNDEDDDDAGSDYLTDMLKFMREVRAQRGPEGEGVAGVPTGVCVAAPHDVGTRCCCCCCCLPLPAPVAALMSQVNVDNNQVGWYRSTYMGSWCTNDLVATQFTYQENIGSNAVVVLYDPLRTTHGSFSLKVRPRRVLLTSPRGAVPSACPRSPVCCASRRGCVDRRSA